ncbi:MAG: aminopeptidase [Geobacteraceae bacterium]|nr:aminopeptidase [Geobacteraceae bacterium]
MENLEAPFLSLLSTNMGVTSGERIVVFSDIIREDEIVSADDRCRRGNLHEAASALAKYADEKFGNASFVDFSATATSGVEPPIVLWKAVFGAEIIVNLNKDGLLERILLKKADAADLESAKRSVIAASADVARVVIAMSNNSTSHTRFRWLANSAGARFASLPHFDPEMFFTSMAVDWAALAQRTANVAQAVNRGTFVRLSTPDGTDLSFSIAGRHAEGDDGLLTAPGSFGNLPAGEAYLAPLEGTAEGVMVICYAPTRKLDPPLTLHIKNGEVASISGNDPHKEWLERKFSESPKNRNIAELGIGTNDRATRPDNVLEAEKILGTVHIALGDNTGFGGVVSTPFHEDYVLYSPTLTVLAEDSTPFVILDRGNLLV